MREKIVTKYVLRDDDGRFHTRDGRMVEDMASAQKYMFKKSAELARFLFFSDATNIEIIPVDVVYEF